MIVRDIVLIHITTAGDEYGTPTKLRTRFAEELFARIFNPRQGDGVLDRSDQ
jgi:hypothetical protein